MNLIETSSKQKQDQFLGLIAQENKTWEEALRKKTLTFEKILGWDSATLTEILSRIQPLTLASAFHGMPTERLDQLFSAFSQSEKRKITQLMDEMKPNPAEKATCVNKILVETRGFIKDGIIKIEKVDPELAIPENYEEQLNTASIVSSLGMTSSDAAASAPAPSAASEVSSSGELRFELPAKNQESANSGNSEEVEFLKKKVNQLVNENQNLKHEVATLRGKLDQIKRIA